MPTGTKTKTRLDVLLVERGLVESRQRAQAMILAGDVFVDNRAVTKAGTAVAVDAAIELRGPKQKFVSRGGLKLEGALEDFGIRVEGKTCLDAGASTGGFTDCLLQHGAVRVFAVDVNVDQLDWKLRQDERVVRVKHNARSISSAQIGESVDFVTVDVSFISLAKVLPALVSVAREGAEFLLLIKPQFELERKHIGKGGIVRDAGLHERAIEYVRAAALACGLDICGVKPSRVAGAEGNLEFFLYARLLAHDRKSVSPSREAE